MVLANSVCALAKYVNGTGAVSAVSDMMFVVVVVVVVSISIITMEIFVIAANEQHNSNDQVVASRSWHLSRASV